jgi:hypothetical protein
MYCCMGLSKKSTCRETASANIKVVFSWENQVGQDETMCLIGKLMEIEIVRDVLSIISYRI